MKKRIMCFCLSLVFCVGLIAGFTLPAMAANGANTETISTGGASQSSYVVKADGTLWGWGTNIVSNNTIIYECLTPVQVMDNVKSTNGMYVIKNDNSLWVTYSSLSQSKQDEIFAQRTDNSADTYNYIRNKLYYLMDDAKTLVGVRAVIKQDDSLWVWGHYEYLFGGINYDEPTKVMDNVKTAIINLNSSYYVLKTDGSLWVSGHNAWGQLGDGTTEYKSEFVKIMDGVVDVSTSPSTLYHTMILKEDGSLWACGSNYYGAIGDGAETLYSMFSDTPVVDNDRYTPIKIMDGVKSIQAGIDCSFAIKEDNSLWGWGNKTYLGTGDKGRQLTPIKLMDDVADIDTHGHTMILKLDGSLWVYGNNVNGQVGDGTTTSIYTPVKIMDGVKLPATATAASPAQPTTPALTAKPTASTVLVNGQQVAFDAYNISGNNYFKLRDLAYALNGSAKQFEIGWDGANNAISLTSGKTYTVVGGEMTGKGAGDKTPTSTSSKIYLDGKEVQLTAYNIEGNNYFKLRDIGEAFDFGVTWDGAKNTIVIDTSKGYAPD